MVETHTLEVLFPIGTGKSGLDLERHLFNVSLILTGKQKVDPDGLWTLEDFKILNVNLQKGAIRRYAMPDRLPGYDKYNDRELYDRFAWENIVHNYKQRD